MLKEKRFAAMYTNYADDIYRFLFVHVRDVQLAEDLTADTFTKAWNQFGSFRGRHDRAWLYTIARNCLTDHWRKKRPVPLDEIFEVVDDAPSHDEIMDKKFRARRVIRAVNALPHDMKSVVTLRFFQGYSVRDTARALELTEANVRVIQYRALKKLKGVLA